jgi:hypothetical protein
MDQAAAAQLREEFKNAKALIKAHAVAARLDAELTTMAAALLGRMGGEAARGKSGAKRRYPKCTVGSRHRFWRGVCKCGVKQTRKK